MLDSTTPLLNMLLRTTLLRTLYLSWRFTVFDNLLVAYFVSSIYVTDTSVTEFCHSIRLFAIDFYAVVYKMVAASFNFSWFVKMNLIKLLKLTWLLK